MKARHEYRQRLGRVQVEVLDALVDRPDDGMTVLELRAHVDASIDDLERALASLKKTGLIHVEELGSRTIIKPDDSVIPDTDATDPKPSLLDRIRDRLPF